MKTTPIEDWLMQPGGLSVRLRTLRTQSKLSGKDLASALRWQPAKVSRIENGRQLPTRDDIEAWVKACKGSRTTLTELLELVDTAQSVHLDWKRRLRTGQAAVQGNYSQLVRDSTLVRHFETVFVPGLLQIPEYARHILEEARREAGREFDEDDIRDAVSERMQRQQMLYDPGKSFEFILAEPVLQWRLCPADVMRAQLDRLLTVVGMTNVRFGILPLDQPIRTIPQNSFQMYDDVAIVETFADESTHQGEEAETYHRAMQDLWNDAVTDDQARQLIHAAYNSLNQE